ncbi:MAG: flavin reductase family protein [Anaerolineaceae bacterium]|jgi:flavin reductase (DIM6/NTAB) family NADH-FMN oxidoreductase RutF
MSEETMEFEVVDLKAVMRRWASGVAILTSGTRLVRHGMTVNSFDSISVLPPLVTVTLNNTTRSKHLVDENGSFAINLLSEEQQELSDRFAGRTSESDDRFEGLEVFYTTHELPLLTQAMAWLECKVVHQYPMPESTLYVGEVLSALKVEDRPPLVYFNQDYHRIT